jgi:pilus assembly protein CpaC
MRQYRFLKCWAAAVCVWLLAAGFLAERLFAEEPPPREDLIFQLSNERSNLQIVETTSRIIQVRGRIATVDGHDPAVLDVTTLPKVANQLRLQAVKSGITTLVITDEFGTRYTIDVTVVGDVRHLEALIQRAFPDASVKAIKINDAVLLTGWVNQQDQLTPIIEVAEQFSPKILNYLKVGGVQQVLLRIKVMEVQRTKIRQLGLNFVNLSSNGYVTSTPGALSPLSALTAPFGGPPSARVSAAGLAAPTATFGILGTDNVFQGFVEALKQEKLLKILAEPNLVTINGRPANFLSGGEIPIPVPQGLGTVTIQWRDFGVRLEFVPYVLGAGRMRLEVSPEVSELDPTKGTSLNGTSVPAITTRRVNTQVEMNFGQSLVIAGMINSQIRAETNKIPFLGELPWVGSAFRRVKHEESETELLILVTPELVSPLEAAQVLADGPGMHSVAPTDRELFGLGMVETPKTGNDCDGCLGAPSEIGPPGLIPPPLAAPGALTPVPAVPNEVLPAPIPGYPADPPRASTRPRLLPPANSPASEQLPPSRPTAQLQQTNGAAAGSPPQKPGAKGRRPLPGLIAPAAEASPEP